MTGEGRVFVIVSNKLSHYSWKIQQTSGALG